MSLETKITKTMTLVKRKSKRSSVAHLTYRGIHPVECKDFFFRSYDRGRTYDLYNGTELVIGDTNLRKCVVAMLDLCGEFIFLTSDN